MRHLLLVLALSGCAGLLPALAQSAQYLGTVLDVASAGAAAYYARHPNQDAQDAVRAADLRVRQELAVYNAALAAGENPSKENLLAAYEELRALLADRVLSATPPDGGAETDAPEPQPFDMPTPGAIFQ